jgi:hypothetical protein
VEDTPLAPDFDDLTTTHVRPIETTKQGSYVVAGLSAAAVLVIFVVGGIWIGQSGGQSDLATDTLVAPTSTAIATSSTLVDLAPGMLPRVLVDDPDWSIVYVHHEEGSNADGKFVNADGKFVVSDLKFGNGEAEAELRMNSGAHADLDALIADRVRDANRLGDQEIWDTTAVIVDIGQGANFTAMWESNAVEYEFVAYDTDESTFRGLLTSLIQTTEEKWIATLPDTIVTDRSAATTEYLADIPVPSGFDTTSLGEGPIEHWYQVGADVVAAVTCAWIEQWADAKAADDDAAIDRAIDAMATSRDWGILHEMSMEGEFSNVVWEYADAIASDGTIVAGEVTTVEASYQRAFGCSS